MTQINTIRNERGETETNTTETKRIVRNYLEKLNAKKCEILDEVDKFLKKYNCQKLNEHEAESLIRPITPDEIETVIKKLPTPRRPRPSVSQENSTENISER